MSFCLTQNPVKEESLLFTETRQGKLLFSATSIESIALANGSQTFREGTDYVFDTATQTLILPDSSSIPTLTLTSPTREGRYERFEDQRGNGLLFEEGHFFHDHQVVVTYRRAGGDDLPQGCLPQSALDQLPNTARLLAEGALRLTLFGDSISAGANASAKTEASPYAPPYGDQIAAGLESHWQAAVTFTNPSVGGKTSGWGLETAASVTEAKPDLVIIAFGMNDGTGDVAKTVYKENIRGSIDAIRTGNEKAEFILVANMLSNPDWSLAKHENHWANRDALMELTEEQDGVIVADIMTLTKELFARKNFANFTGNNVNHPNDFLHRLMADFILTQLSQG
ncbi:MAG: SGNH/GDSL hydrolase family protein [Planctomycetota bacterium]|jgi:hypothetical protein